MTAFDFYGNITDLQEVFNIAKQMVAGFTKQDAIVKFEYGNITCVVNKNSTFEGLKSSFEAEAKKMANSVSGFAPIWEKSKK